MRALIIGLALLALPRTLAYEEEEDVVVLEGKDGRNDFDQFIQSEKLALVEFWAPWCGHCKELTPKWSEAARRAKKLPHPVRLATATHATTECLAHHPLATRSPPARHSLTTGQAGQG